MADLPAQNNALRKDIAEMVHIVNKLREENDTYRQNFENVCKVILRGEWY